MKQPRTFNRVRTDLLEIEMSHYLASGEFEKYQAIKSLSEKIGAPVNIKETIRRAIQYRHYDQQFENSDLIYLLQNEE